MKPTLKVESVLLSTRLCVLVWITFLKGSHFCFSSVITFGLFFSYHESHEKENQMPEPLENHNCTAADRASEASRGCDQLNRGGVSRRRLAMLL